ncbi:MAG TPA: sigma-70 family RNA polymerase sigma factor [Thermoanaerobaculia bacterium]|nr:sigma-70 family RNA polymerase sigma factor [Thermoanaerobaculia bacterium]
MKRIEELYAKYRDRLLRTFRRVPDAEDIAQEALIRVWKRMEHVSLDHEWAYLATTARSIANKRFRRANVPRRGAGLLTQLDETEHDTKHDAPSVEEQLIEQQEIAAFRAHFNAVLAEFTPDTQQCLVLAKRGYNSKEIAKHLGLTDQAVRSRLSRMRAVFRERLDPPPAVNWMDLLGDDDDHKD